eukprot:TRINITY_DN16918_c0_g1_i4.p1 TRINITY_DN16918_c0_g1~~TRINITY_DN16918_c0_g1_i4.p1  ORF type:complete len:230 (+),score=53.06 TRINITY_DN16918_c0_g1_i4:721-1410(+)
MIAAGGVEMVRHCCCHFSQCYLLKELKVFSSVDKKLDSKATAKAVFGDNTKPPKFGDELVSTPLRGWIEACAWSPSGETLAVATHESRVTMILVGLGGSFGTVEVHPVNLRGLPLTSLVFANDSTLVGAGYDMDPLKLAQSANGWVVEGHLDERKQKNVTRNVKQQMIDMAARAGQALHEHDTTHENTITSIRSVADGQFTTSGLDGRIAVWNISNLQDCFAKLKLSQR